MEVKRRDGDVMVNTSRPASDMCGAFRLIVSFILVVATPAPGQQREVRCEGPLTIEGLPEKDTCYDWGGHVIVVDDVHHMWWTRFSTTDGEFDTIWHATSTDGMHWRDARKVLVPAGSEHEKMHVADPSVVKVGRTFYMFYESNHRVDAEASESQILLATSNDGVEWKRHPNDESPEPVIALGAAAGSGRYGIGMPSVHYRDGRFHMFYLTSLGGPDTIRYARTKDPRDWGRWTDHPIVGYGAGFDVKYSKTLKQYVMCYAVLSDLTPDPSGETTYEIHAFCSPNGRIWNRQPAPRLWRISADSTDLARRCGNAETPRTRAFPTLSATDAHGCIEGERLRIIFMEGDMHPIPGDWKVTHRTWDLHALTFSLDMFDSRRP